MSLPRLTVLLIGVTGGGVDAGAVNALISACFLLVGGVESVDGLRRLLELGASLLLGTLHFISAISSVFCCTIELRICICPCIIVWNISVCAAILWSRRWRMAAILLELGEDDVAEAVFGEAGVAATTAAYDLLISGGALLLGCGALAVLGSVVLC